MTDSNEDDERPNEAEWIRTGFARRDQPAGPDAAGLPPDPPSSGILVDWVDQHRPPKHPPDPAWPNGAAIDVALNALRACRLELPYPAARCGLWVITCKQCGYAMSLATTGQADDPRSVRVPCRLH
jgi:hypothetical protein